MKKVYAKRLLIAICLMFTCLTSIFNFSFSANAEQKKIYVGGMTAGFSMDLRGVFIVGISDVLTENGFQTPSKDCGLKPNDVILSIDEKSVNNSEDIAKAICDGKRKTLVVKRKNKNQIIDVTPAKDVSGQYKLGIFIKEKINGIGTITYFTDSDFVALGHPVVDENGEILEITGGNVFQSSIKGIVKGRRGFAGELKGVFISQSNFGSIKSNQINGLYGKMYRNPLPKEQIEKGEAKVGNAKIRCSVDNDQIKEYDIQIVKTENVNDKNLVIKVIDRELVALTGGIVQGMSGSPIIQDGKLVGAVTHVFLNDPLRGYGLSIDNMKID